MIMIITNIKFKLVNFFNLNLVALKIYKTYKYNIYLMVFIFICVICSIIFRSNLFLIPSFAIIDSGFANTMENITSTNNVVFNYYNIFIFTLVIFSTIYSLKLIFDIICRCAQAYKIIPEFIKLYKQNMINIKSIISLYYIQNVFFILLSLWILYVILTKLNTFIEDIHLFIITLGIISSIIFISYYSLPNFYIYQTSGKEYTLSFYLFLTLFILLYMLIFPLIIINVINSDKFITYFKDYDSFMTNSLSKSKFYNYMDGNKGKVLVKDNNSIKVASSSSDDVDVSGNNSIEITRTSTRTRNTQSQSEAPVTILNLTQLVVNNPLETPHALANLSSPASINDSSSSNEILQSKNSFTDRSPTDGTSKNTPLTIHHRQKTITNNLLDYYKNSKWKGKSPVIDNVLTNRTNLSSLVELPSSCEALVKDIVPTFDLHSNTNYSVSTTTQQRISSIPIYKPPIGAIGNGADVINTSAPVVTLQKPKFDILTFLKKRFGLGVKSIKHSSVTDYYSHSQLTVPTIPTVQVPDTALHLKRYNLANIEIPRIRTHLYDNLMESTECFIYYLDKNKTLSIGASFHLNLSQHLKELENILDATVNTQLIFMNLSGVKDKNNEIDFINSLIKKYRLNINKSSFDNVQMKFHKDMFIFLTSQYKEKGLDIDHLREFYVINDFDYLNSTLQTYNTLTPSTLGIVKKEMIYSKILFELCYCHNQIIILRNSFNSIGFNKNINKLCDLYEYNYSNFISKFDTNLENYCDQHHVKINQFKKSREINYIADLINKYSINAKNKS